MRGIGPITPREEQVLSMMAEHCTYEEIAEDMSINIVTVYNHVSSVMIKTGLHRKELIIKYAIEHGYGRESVTA